LFDLLAVGCLLDLLHDGVDLGVAPWVDGSALLVTGHAADVGGNVVQDGGEGDIDNISLAEGGGDGELIFLKNEKKSRNYFKFIFCLQRNSYFLLWFK
jgi:hypothetical protein